MEKWQKKTNQALEKKAEASEKQGEKKDENKTSGKDDKKNRKTHDEAMGVDKEEKKTAQPLEKGKRKLHKAALHKAALLPNRKVLLPVRQNLTQNIAGKRKSKRKKQQEKKQAEEQQKKQPSYLEVVVKGGPLEKGQNQPKKKGKLDDMQYVSLGSSSSSSSVAQPQPPTPPQPSRLRGFFEKKACPGLAQLLPDKGAWQGCCAKQAHQGLLGSAS